MTYTQIPPELRASCKCEPIDPDWPIQDPLEALNLLQEWSEKENDPGDHVYRLTHSHHHEWGDLAKYGVDETYKKSRFTKYVSIAWHLAGRYTYDNGLIQALESRNWPRLRLVDFGAACWIQALFYAKKGLKITVVNQGLESDVNRFGRWLAEKKHIKGIREYSSDDPEWTVQEYDVIYAVDVFEHIPPLPDGTPGWIPIANSLYDCLVPDGFWFVNAPFGIDPGVPKPVDTHPGHYTSPIHTQEWCLKKGLKEFGSCLWRKA